MRKIAALEKVREATVAASAPVVQNIVAAVVADFAAIVPAGTTVSTAAGAITQIAATTPATAGQAAIVTTTTIAPLVNASGQPTGQVAVQTTTGGVTTTQIAGLSSTNAASLTLSVASTGATTTSYPMDANVNARPATVQGSNAAERKSVELYNKIVALDPNLTTTVTFANGKTAKLSILEALAAGKITAADAAQAFAVYLEIGVLPYTAAEIAATFACDNVSSSTTSVTVSFQATGFSRTATQVCRTRVVTFS